MFNNKYYKQGVKFHGVSQVHIEDKCNKFVRQ